MHNKFSASFVCDSFFVVDTKAISIPGFSNINNLFISLLKSFKFTHFRYGRIRGRRSIKSCGIVPLRARELSTTNFQAQFVYDSLCTFNNRLLYIKTAVSSIPLYQLAQWQVVTKKMPQLPKPPNHATFTIEDDILPIHVVFNSKSGMVWEAEG
jgi:hypothetical protein